MISSIKKAVGKKVYEDATLSVKGKVSLLSEIFNCKNKREIFESLLENAPHILKEGPLTAVTGLVVPVAAFGAYRGIRSLVDPCSKACGSFNIDTLKRKKCMLLCKKKLLNLKIEQIEEEDCDSVKNPRKCKLLKQVRINEIKKKINEIDKSLSI
jgi:hypothetical protein